MALPATIRGLNTATDPESVRQRVEALEHLLEGLFTIPGTNRKIGLDVILDLVPIGGDVVGAALGGYMIWEARNLGLSKWQMSRMAGNVGIDFLLGLIPWIGAVPDFLFRSNSRNLKIISRALDQKLPAAGRERATSAPMKAENR
jgi:hypothetical protein